MMLRLDRRKLLQLPLAASALGLGCAPARATLPDPREAPFDTVVVLMLENRSFDHLLGWLPGANGRQAGLAYPDKDGRMQPTFPLYPDFQGCGHDDPEHTWQAISAQYGEGRCDGWLTTPASRPGDNFAIGYYRAGELPVLAALAQGYTTFDNYFCAMMGPTWENRLYQLSGTTQLMENCDFPREGEERPVNIDLTIFDRLREAGLSAAYYYHASPITKLFRNGRYDTISHPVAQFWADARDGRLANVVFIDPDYSDLAEDMGTSNDYHPWSNLLTAEGLLARVHDALAASPQWQRMVFVANFDEHGGFFDHVPPPTCEDDTVVDGPDLKRLGFRVPAIAIGPFAPRRIESAGPYEHCSILRMIEWRWGLEPMRLRDAKARNLAEALDFSSHRDPIQLPDFTPPPTEACPAGAGWIETPVTAQGRVTIDIQSDEAETLSHSARLFSDAGDLARFSTDRPTTARVIRVPLQLDPKAVASIRTGGNRLPAFIETIVNGPRGGLCRSTSPVLLRIR